jgi:Protein of unknown function (DUF1553)/Protein of unknown function (DUF1549)/Planctomycete cytochrome C
VQRSRLFLLFVPLLLLAGPSRTASQRTVDYTTEIEPILRSSCYSCHTGEKPRAGLRLDNKAAALTGGVSGKVIVPGNSRASLILERLLATEKSRRMPFGGSPLPPETIELVRAWIDQGAPWPDEAKSAAHWAYLKPTRPALPKLIDATWARNPIDAFVLERLEKEGLAPSPEASKATLVRRVTLDLIGLPPSVDEVDQFINDTSPDAYDTLVDRLLRSPHYGERWARPWLDLARYADTNGYEKDRARTMWKYRDWVIEALNKDLPFDQFTIEQVAGDMLPNATVAQRIATGFHRNTMFNEEGGVDKEEAHWENLVDRVNTTATVWLGTTLGCAQCHNHKYDPFTQREYYQLLAFFNNADTDVRDSGDTSQQLIEPRLDLPTPEQEERKQKLQAEIQELQQRVNTQTPELSREQADWERAVVAADSVWTPVIPTSAKATSGTTLSVKPDGTIIASGANPRNEVYTIEATTTVQGMTAVRLEALPHDSLPRGGPGRDAYGNFFVSAFQMDTQPAASDGQPQPIAFREMLADNGTVRPERPAQLWTVDASREEQRLARQIVFVTATPLGMDQTRLHVRIRQDSEFNGQGIGHFRLSVTASPDPAKIVAVSHRLRPVLAIPANDRTDAQRKDLADYFRTIAPSLKPARQQLAQLRRELDKLGIISALVLRERAGFDRPSTQMRIRGAFLSKGDLVYAGVPAALHPLPENVLPNRLGLARWLVSPENPLTARVVMNRSWEQLFGRGLVETSEDFGSQGARPTHPALLDWLASEFVEKKWSMKAMHRLIVTSATYRQSSRVTPALVERDPTNRLLARGPRFRMEAEMIRDVTLAASGLLTRKVGGPSVFPPQPDGIWDLPYNDDKWIESKGDDRYRRGLYTFLRRTAPYPSLLAFDATSREACTVRRVRTNTPLQALTTLNDPAFFEAAQALARRVLAESGPAPNARAELAFRLCVARKPTPAEVDRILRWHDERQRFFAAAEHQEDARKIAGKADVDLAAWTMVANVLLNLDETLTKE